MNDVKKYLDALDDSVSQKGDFNSICERIYFPNKSRKKSFILYIASMGLCTILTFIICFISLYPKKIKTSCQNENSYLKNNFVKYVEVPVSVAFFDDGSRCSIYFAVSNNIDYLYFDYDYDLTNELVVFYNNTNYKYEDDLTLIATNNEITITYLNKGQQIDINLKKDMIKKYL